MPKISGIPHKRAVRAFERAGFNVVREGKHVVMANGKRTITIPRHDPVNGYTRRRSRRGAVPQPPLKPICVETLRRVRDATSDEGEETLAE